MFLKKETIEEKNRINKRFIGKVIDTTYYITKNVAKDHAVLGAKIFDKIGITNELEEKVITKFENNKYDPVVRRKAELTYGLRNFIGNASKFSKSLVEIKIESNNEITQIKVCDDGPGFPEDVKNFLGEPYIHSKNRTIDSKSGLGLGTFIGKTLLERMKASVNFGTCPALKGAMVTIEWQTKNLFSI